MSTTEKRVSIQIGPGAMFSLFLVFLVLKLTGVIGWSWWWVTAPLWGGLAFTLSVLALVAGMAGTLFTAAAVIDWFKRWK